MIPLMWTQSSPELESLDKEDQGRLARGASPKALFMGGGSIIQSNVITHVLTNSSDMNLKSKSFGFYPLKAQTLVIAPLTKPFMTSDRDVCTTSVIGDSKPNNSKIGTPFMKKYIWSRDDALSVRSDVSELNKLDTAVQKYSTDERNTAPSRIEKVF